ncbi:MAG: phospholipase D family protein [Pseudomonadota bacterium]|nr:phospholipase D family protein [Pseudomonadota bacterium]
MIPNRKLLCPANAVSLSGRYGVTCLKPARLAAMMNCMALMVFAMLVVGCASVPRDYPRTPSTAYPDYLDTSVGQLFEEAAVQHPGESGFAIIRYGRQAFTARIALTELAEKSLDVQYYIWEADATGRILAERLVQAADRGVKVRILVDDINLAGRDAVVAAMDAHPNIEIHVFNPFAHRDARILDFTLDLDRVNHRMHNKIMVMDNAVAIVGGRNIGNHYFGVATDANFRDLDIAAAGPVVRDISNVFDHFWNGDWAVPIAALVDRPYTEADLQAAFRTVRERIATDDYPYPLDEDVTGLRSKLASIRDNLIWAPGQILWDDPAAIEEGLTQGTMIKALFKKVQMLQNDLIIESAYFVPGDKGVEALRQLHERGVRVRVLTNSLASNDVVAAHAGHAKYRDELVADGVELYEMRPDAGVIKKKLVSGTSKAALHTKALVFDRESVFIGSFNLDPRSGSINTEAGLYVESPELAAQVLAYMDEGVLPENSYRVLLDGDGDLVWVTEVEGHEVRFHVEPETGLWERFMSGFIQILPVEHQL